MKYTVKSMSKPLREVKYGKAFSREGDLNVYIKCDTTRMSTAINTATGYAVCLDISDSMLCIINASELVTEIDVEISA